MWPFGKMRRDATSEVERAGVQVLRGDHFDGSGLNHQLRAGQGFAMGLNWHPIVAADYEKAALSRAIATKSTHYVHSPFLTFVGTAKLQRAEAKLKLFSLASIFAKSVAQEIGTSVMVLQLDEDSAQGHGSELVWFCAVVNRSIRQGTDVVIPASEAQQFIDELKKVSGAMKVWGESGALRQLQVEVDDALGWQQLFVEFNNNTEPHALRLARQNLLDNFKSVPKGFIWLGVAAIGILLWKSALGPMVSKTYARFTSKPPVVEQPLELWAEALQATVRDARLSEPAALTRLAESISSVPLSVGIPGARWQLKTVQCDANLRQKLWLCRAAYDAIDKSATNLTFKAAAQPAWGVEFQPLKKATFTMSFPLAVRPLVLKEQRSRNEHLLITASSLQRLQPVLKESARPIGDFAPLAVPNPTFTNGQPAPLPVEFKLPLTAQIQVGGPLRTVYAMGELERHISWRGMRINFDPSIKPDATSSALTMEATGEIYANQ